MRPTLPILLSSLLLCSPLAAEQPAAQAPKLTMKPWITRTVNGSADAEGKNALVVRARNIVLLSDIASGKKPTERIIARPQEGSSMGFGQISPDGRYGTIMDDVHALIIVAFDGGKTRTLTSRYMVSSSLFTPNSDAVLWWRREGPLERGHHAVRPANAEIIPPCVIYRMALGADARPVKTTLSGCKDIVKVSPDGAYAVVGEGGGEHALASYGDTPQDGKYYWYPLKADSYARFHRVELATGETTLIGERELLAVSVSDDGRVVCGSEPKAFQAEGPARVVCLRGGEARDLVVPAAEDPKRGWRKVSVSPDGGKLAIALQSGPEAKQRGLTYVLSLNGAQDKPLISERTHASSLIWLPGGRRLFATPDDAPARLYDLAAGWSIVLGKPGQEVSGLITLGQRDDRFLVGVERKSTRDMWMVELSR
jgi:hypothetical protein